ncbi:MAG: hypothetical protein OEZ43_07785 [Gammaproteobacteria bacterium]|nr:hypothetical protein [Gammaproteobacteria bacterium]
MGIKIVVNNREVTNPFARLVGGVLAVFITLLIGLVLLFIALPVMWFSVSAMLVILLSVLVTAPRLLTQAKEIRKQLPPKDENL